VECTSSDEEEVDWVKMGNDSNKGQALMGMAKSATYLFEENISVLTSLISQGYVIRCTGHSLGGGVASLLGVLIKRHLRAKGMRKNLEDLIRVYSFGTPSCVNEDLVREVGGEEVNGKDSFITSVILHDDIVPRISPTSVRRLMKHLLYVKETWVDKNFRDDVEAVADRVKKIWEPRWRNSFVVKEGGAQGEGKALGSGETIPQPSPPPPVDLEQSLIDPSQFYDAEEELIDSDSDDSDCLFNDVGESISSLGNLGRVEEECGEDMEEPVLERENSPNSPTSPVMLPESPLPRMFIPGDIYHIYKHNGTYKACKVPRKFKELRRISLSPNMVSDHSCKGYYEALLEVRSVRGAKSSAPAWQPFHSASKCTACQSEFTWASTSKSEAQVARDKVNCHACGMLVCGPCSTRSVALPEFGIERERRVCDSCFFDLGFREGNGDSAMARSYVDSDSDEEMEEGAGGEMEEADEHTGDDKVEGRVSKTEVRQTSRSRTDSGRRRSSIVDQLVSNLQNTG